MQGDNSHSVSYCLTNSCVCGFWGMSGCQSDCVYLLCVSVCMNMGSPRSHRLPGWEMLTLDGRQSGNEIRMFDS